MIRFFVYTTLASMTVGAGIALVMHMTGSLSDPSQGQEAIAISPAIAPPVSPTISPGTSPAIAPTSPEVSPPMSPEGASFISPETSPLAPSPGGTAANPQPWPLSSNPDRPWVAQLSSEAASSRFGTSPTPQASPPGNLW